MEMLIFENPKFFYLFLLIPFLVGIFLLARHYNRIALINFGDNAIIKNLMPMVSSRRPLLKMSLMIFAICMLIIALVNPKIGSKMEEVKREGVDIVVAIDVSRSMLAEDIKPNRIDRAKAAVSRLIDNLGNDRIGVVAFAGNAVTQVPITSDHSAAKMILRTLNINTVTAQGTSIGGAIERSMASFLDRELKNKTIIIISDGENHLDDPIEVAKKAANENIIIHTIGIGTPEGAPIPIYQNNRLSGFLKDTEGNTVISRYDAKTLQDIASTTGGVFKHGMGADMGLNSILDEIKSLEKEEYETTIFADYESRFHYFFALALFFLLLELVIFERKNKWIDKIKVFGNMKYVFIILIFLAPYSLFGQSENDLIRKGNKQYKKENYNEAEVNYLKSLEKNPSNAKALFNLGNSLYKQGRYEEAAGIFDALTKMNISQNIKSQAFHNLGNSHLNLQDYAKGVDAYKESLRIDPSDMDTRYNLIYAMNKLQQQEQQQDQQQNDQKEDKQNKQEDKKDQQNQDKKEDQKEQQQKPDQLSPQDAERILEALKQEEQKVLENMEEQKQKSMPFRVKREW